METLNLGSKEPVEFSNENKKDNYSKIIDETETNSLNDEVKSTNNNLLLEEDEKSSINNNLLLEEDEKTSTNNNEILDEENGSNLKKLYNILDYLKDNLSNNDLLDLSNYTKCIYDKCRSEDGSGLNSGHLIDMMISEYFKEKLEGFETNYSGESDMKINGIPISLKKIDGKSIIALDWSKNNSSSNKRNYFNIPIMIINIKEEQWWKAGPLKYKKKLKNEDTDNNSELNTDFTKIIPRGIYLVDNDYCSKIVKLSSNNKTNTLVTSEYLYKMLLWSLENKLYIELPLSNRRMKFNILKAMLYDETN
jgi:hypothetical protein